MKILPFTIKKAKQKQSKKQLLYSSKKYMFRATKTYKG